MRGWRCGGREANINDDKERRENVRENKEERT